MLVSLARQRTEELRNNLVVVRSERDDYYTRLRELEDLLDKFKEEYNPNFNDEGVKRAVRAWEDYAARGKAREVSELQNLDLDEIAKPDKENGLDWEEYESGEEGEGSDTDVCMSHPQTPAFSTLKSYRLTNLRQYTPSKPTSPPPCATG